MSRLVLERIYYPVLTLGYGKRIGVWVRGCARGCPECISPELQTYEGREIEVEEITRRIPKDLSVDGLTISGGEPFDQSEGIAELVRWFEKNYGGDILIFTGYTYEELVSREDKSIQDILGRIAVLVDGPYVAGLNNGIGLRGSANQRLIIRKFQERYADAECWERKVQFVGEGDSLIQIGIPPAEFRPDTAETLKGNEEQ